MSNESKHGGGSPKPVPEDEAPELTDEQLDGTSGGDKSSPLLAYFPKVEIDSQLDTDLARATQDIIKPRTFDPTIKKL